MSDHPPSGERGASSVEYAMLIAGIAGILVLILVALGGLTVGMFDETCDQIDPHVSANC